MLGRGACPCASAKVEDHSVGEVVRVTVRRPGPVGSTGTAGGGGGRTVELKVHLTELRSRM